MNLRYITLFMDYDSGFENSIRDNFNLSSRFISNYLSVQIRNLKYTTDGTYKMISVAPSISVKSGARVIGEGSLQARILFDHAYYQNNDEVIRYEYFLKLLEEGYYKCSEIKEIPLAHLLKLHDTFRNSGYKNEWLHKKKKFIKEGIEVALNCFFTSFDFRLVITVVEIKSKQNLISGTVIRTLPDEVCFEKLFKDVVVENNELIITEFQNRPKFKFKLSDIFKKKMTFEILNNGLVYEPFI